MDDLSIKWYYIVHCLIVHSSKTIFLIWQDFWQKLLQYWNCHNKYVWPHEEIFIQKYHWLRLRSWPIFYSQQHYNFWRNILCLNTPEHSLQNFSFQSKEKNFFVWQNICADFILFRDQRMKHFLQVTSVACTINIYDHRFYDRNLRSSLECKLRS
jgi:hypothetical protein